MAINPRFINTSEVSYKFSSMAVWVVAFMKEVIQHSELKSSVCCMTTFGIAFTVASRIDKPDYLDIHNK